MHPAPSVIFFSVFSGLGFGLLVWLGLGVPAVTGTSAFAFFTIAYLLAVGGLISSTFHLGHPERALKAFTQWRSSWLSREAWCAVAALVLMGIYGLGLVFFDTRWTLLGILGALFSIGTVFTTSMIYAQLKTVPRWNMPLTPLNFLSLSLAGGALLAGQVKGAMLLIVIAGGIQIVTWMLGDKRLAQSGSDMASATQLGGIGSVRAFEPPHTGTNYLLREFVHVIGRKHATKLRIIALALMSVLPVLLLLLPFNHILAVIAVLAHVGGVLTARWLFFAQAEHVVGLYYGKR
ncbi:dimethyl sulfoxide reductase anchor subunit family protein [Sulfitobacter geojensis]|uniref:Dimethyl sulfoxide reductase anchor subunit n=1 Tax=Sulfitobacter geojensis TaxID=1342299 RepID=A0AAE3B785_9RHOB|nr:DmsC/YnfH family molybdoenzyme membrane anchor subunit [Sulfitobacter geojensis]KHA53798.1 Anaerobic dimethyl sulfoxide reductase chain C [Sulfitobacter geojensis]MBM1690528.1 dimethyl sulfoxide reductase anchor subunit [Sulfitobacter geojensis]MBM1694594.1 dimethyl sulfoxide reductase anchor subunit [Sulfitobacter geojensis]MBM1706760.1 dimethyl sulfoxide reductase anchor subunit [Sulfitobacter geojensis]MBM1710818.1 dimethyl sulfoxide reductase anchor subunit [Sulfitobacter geojensis]